MVPTGRVKVHAGRYVVPTGKDNVIGVSREDANLKFLRALPSSLSQVSLIMRTRTRLDTLSFDDLYNNLRVFESDVKGPVESLYSSSYVDEVMHSFFANQSNAIEVSYEDLTQVDKHDLEEMNLKWQMAMLSMRVNKFYKKTWRRLKFNANEPAGFDKSKVECFKCHKMGHFARECRSKGTQDSKRRDASLYCSAERRILMTDALMAFTSDNEVDLDDKTNLLEYHKKLLAEAIQEKEDLKSKLEKFQNSSKGLAKLLNSQLSAKDKSGLGFDGQITESDLFNFDMKEIPPPLTGIYMPPRSIFGLDESNFSYGPKQSNTSESEPKTSKFDSCESNSSVESLESMPKPVVSEPKVLIKPRVWSDAPIIKEYESDSDDDYEIRPSKEQVTPSYAFVNTAKHVKIPRESVNVNSTYSQSPKVDKRDWNGRMSKTLGLGYSFTKKGKGTGSREERPVWNNVQRTNHQNNFVPQSILTKSGRFPINTGKHNFTSQPASIRSVRKVNTGRPKENTPSDLEDEGIVDSECSRHMIGNKEHLDEYQDIKGGLVTFGGSKGNTSGSAEDSLKLK
ncbi:ribonuclease H-like domain-containing protein [Tanacetum coccineum]